MLVDGLKFTDEGSASNMNIAKGTEYPTNANEGELFYLIGSGLSVYDGAAWSVVGSGAGGGGGSGEATIISVNQVAHGFTVEQALSFNGSWILAKSDSSNTIGTGVVSEVIDVDNFKLCMSGKVTLSGLTAGTWYYVSGTVAGELIANEPGSGYSNPIGYAISATELIVVPYRASLLSSSSPSGRLGGIVGHARVDVGNTTVPCTGIIAADSSIPQITEGTEALSLVYTPKYANSKLLVKSKISGIATNNGASTISAIFQEGQSDALAVTSSYDVGSVDSDSMSAEAEINNPGTNPITFSVRVGSHIATTYHVNGNTSGTLLYGGVWNNYLEVVEINLDPIQGDWDSGEIIQTRMVQVDSPSPTNQAFSTGFSIIDIDFTPKSTDSFLMVDVSVPVYLDSNYDSVNFAVKEDGVVALDGKFIIGAYTSTTPDAYIATGKIKLPNTSNAMRNIEIYVGSLANSPLMWANGGVRVLTITEVQN